MKDGFYTWSEFRNEVLALMPLEKDRLIQGDDGQLLERYIKLAVIDLQKFVPVYTLNRETVYLPSDFVIEMHASHSVLPPNARLRDVWLFDTNNNRRFPVTEFPWERRFEMVNGHMNLSDHNGRLALDPYGDTFYIYPMVQEGWLVSVYWDGLKSEFRDDEETPFDTLAVAAAADFVQAELSRVVKNDLQISNSYAMSYAMKRRDCFLNATERMRV